MKKYILDYIVEARYNAGPKAREDVNQIMQKKGYELRHLYFCRKNAIRSIVSILKFIVTWPSCSNVFLQYPIGDHTLSSLVICCLRLKKCSVDVLVHDVESLRRTGKLSSLERNNLKNANHVIAHTRAMKRIFVENGVPENKVDILGIFDYLTIAPPYKRLFNDNIVVFAGNLDKSYFINYLKDLKVRFNLYGITKNGPSSFTSEEVKYCGCFQSGDLSSLSGSWGLVWDGEVLDTCNGVLGEYQRYNAPHKLSMCIAAGLPVIVWSESAEAEFVLSHNIGITIDSLKRLKDVLSNIDNIEYAKKSENVLKMSELIRKGCMILNASNNE